MSLRESIARLNKVFSRRRADQGIKENVRSVTPQVRSKIILLLRDVTSGALPGRQQVQYDYDQGYFWSEVHNLLEHSIGSATLSQAMANNFVHWDNDAERRDLALFLRECTTKQFLDFVELCFQTEHYPRIGSDDSNVIDAINEIFLNENSPYRMTSFVRKEEVEDVFIYGNRQRRTVVRIIHYPQVIYTEDEVVYREALAPALTALSRAEFTVADGEFRTGLEHYREGRYGDFLSNCSSALESVLKVICDKHNIQFDSNSALSTLLETVAAGLGLEAVYAEKFKLLATIRNRLSSSHGGGSQPRDPEPPYARLMLNLAAAAMVFLVETSDSK